MKSIRECVGFTDNLQRDLTVGWNTWDTRSVLRHVLLPEGLCIGLGLAALDKLVWLDQAFFGLHELGRTAGTVLTSLDRSLPIGNALEVRPGLHAYDGSYTEMEVNLRGARFKIETAAEGDGWTALILPLQEEPWPRALTIHVCFLWNRPGYAERVSDRCIRATTPERGISIYAEGKPFADPNLPAVSPYLSFRLDHPVVISAVGLSIYPEPKKPSPWPAINFPKVTQNMALWRKRIRPCKAVWLGMRFTSPSLNGCFSR